MGSLLTIPCLDYARFLLFEGWCLAAVLNIPTQIPPPSMPTQIIDSNRELPHMRGQFAVRVYGSDLGSSCKMECQILARM